MSRNLANQTNVQAPNADYPSGRIKDDTGLSDGTPVDESLYGDIHQLMMKILRTANITPNNLPDNETNGYQLYEGLYDSFAREPLGFNGVFAGTPDSHSLGSTGTTSAVLASDQFNIYYVDRPASNSVLNSINRKTGITTALGNVDTPSSITYHNGFIYMAIDGVGIKAYNATTGVIDNAKTIGIAANLKGLKIYNDIIYVGDRTNEYVRRYSALTNNQGANIGGGFLPKSLDVAYNHLFLVDENSNEITVINLTTTSSTDAFVALTGFFAEEVRVYGGKIYVSNLNGVDRTLTVHSLDTTAEVPYFRLTLPSSVVSLDINRNELRVLDLTSSPRTIEKYDQFWQA